MSKLALGTAQFGLDYGINNSRGRIPANEIAELLVWAFKSGIDTLDTAAAYGESEKLLGNFNSGHKEHFRFISKLPKCSVDQAESIIYKSLKDLNIPAFYGYLLHNYQVYQANPKLWTLIERLRETGKIKKIGFSLYLPSELDELLKEDLPIDLIQVPFNLFDRRFGGHFKKLKEKNIEIHTRSVFLQGLFFKEPESLSQYFSPIKTKLTKIREIAKENGVSIAAIALCFALANKEIDKVVVGVDNLDNLKELVADQRELPLVKKLQNQLSDLIDHNDEILLPYKWPALASVK